MLRLDVSRMARIVAESIAQFVHANSQRGLSHHDLRPERGKQFVFGDEAARSSNQVEEHFEDARAKRTWFAVAPKAARRPIKLKRAEPIDERW